MKVRQMGVQMDLLMERHQKALRVMLMEPA
jgi:hypothetical protein